MIEMSCGGAKDAVVLCGVNLRIAHRMNDKFPRRATILDGISKAVIIKILNQGLPILLTPDS
jgi:hypothetical protein